jgi:hypothetical protein
MPKLTKLRANMISNLLCDPRRKTKVSDNWRWIMDEYNVGRLRGGLMEFTGDDLRVLKQIYIAEVGYDPTTTSVSGNRTEVARFNANEKFSTESVRQSQVSCTALGGPLRVEDDEIAVIPEMDYRLNWTRVRLEQYDGVVVIENYEAFIFIDRFVFLDIGHCLVLYRGHDYSAKNVLRMLEMNTAKRVFGFTDPDPAGLGILLDNPRYTDALVPKLDILGAAPSLSDRFARQLSARPDIKDQLAGCSEALRHYGHFIVDEGIAVSQEWLCSHEVPLDQIAIRAS